MAMSGCNLSVDLYLCAMSRPQPALLVQIAILTVSAGISAVLALGRARETQGFSRKLWGALAGLVLGTGAWASQLLGVVATFNDYPFKIEVLPTVLALLLAVATAIGAVLLALRAKSQAEMLAAAAVFSLGLMSLHLIGKEAFHLPLRLDWNVPVLAWLPGLYVLVSTPLFVPAVVRRHRLVDIAAALWFTPAMAAIYMAALFALDVAPGTPMPANGPTIPAPLLPIAVAALYACLIAAGLVAFVANRRARAELERSERQFSLLVKGTTDYAICMLDRDGRVSQWNAGAQQMTGYDAAEAIGMPLSAFYIEEERAAGIPARALNVAQTDGVHAQRRLYQRQGGKRFWVHTTVEKVTDRAGRPLGFALIMRDISEYTAAEAMVAETSRRLDTALENMHEGLCLFDAEERVVLCNRRFRELWDLAEEHSAPGTSLGALVIGGFMNPDGIEHASRCLHEFRQILGQTLGDRGTGPTLVELSQGRIVSLANRALSEGGWVTTCADITEQRRSEAKIEYMALHDALTGLPNRARFYARLDQEIRSAEEDGAHLAVLAIDLDRFKEVNDAFGHASGDKVLQTIAERFAAMCSEGEIVARLGGDEFAATMRFSDPAEIEEFAFRLRQAVIRPIEDGDHCLVVGASLGVAIYPQNGATREALLNNADLAMYRAKSIIGQDVCYFEAGMDEVARERRQLASDLRQAIARGELSLLYQPQRQLKTGALSGYEALLRWRHPLRGLVPPDQFIPIAEETGEILHIGEWVLRQACAEARCWPDDQKVAVNLSAVQFLQTNLVETIRQVLLETGLPARRLELEITETAIISDKLRALHYLRQIKAMGVSVAIDDFGTGYSSLDTLHSFPFDKIKIDKSFLLKADTNGQARAIIRAVLALGRSLEIPVLAEGVENEAQLRVLQVEGCDEAQGYYFGRPGNAPSQDLPGALAM